ncbi:MAG: bshA [Sphingobacteriales bacterium]|nr:bshA [Sphingobacteriales bacterium]
MKILHILHELKFSGAEIMYVDAAPVFREKGCELSVVATALNLGEYAKYFEKAEYTLFHKPYPPLKNYFKRIIYYIWVIKLLKHEKYDVVHIHSNNSMWGMALCAWVAGKRSVYTFHNVFPTHFYSYPYHILLRLSAKHIFKCRFQSISDSVYEHELNLYHNKTTKIYNWYGSNRYYPPITGEKTLIRKKLEISKDALVLISVGGCSPVKRHSDIVKALPIILKEFPNTIYLHLGTGISLHEEINLANELKVEEHIRFEGNQTDVREYLIASDIYLMPSKFEGISITTIEALACMIPSVLYNVPGLRDFNKTRECSILVDENFEILAKSIVQLFKDMTKQTEISVNGKYLVDKDYNMKTNVQKIYNLYVEK